MIENLFTPAIASFCGVVAGIITSWLLAQKRERSEAKKEEAARDIELKKAARLVLSNLLEILTLAELCLDQHWRWVPDDRVNTNAWEKYKDVLAATLPDDDWWNVFLAFAQSSNLKSLGLPDRPIGEVSVAIYSTIVPLIKSMERGIEVLSPYGGLTKAK